MLDAEDHLTDSGPIGSARAHPKQAIRGPEAAACNPN